MTPLPASLPPAVQVIAMHGWAGDSRAWGPWLQASAPLGWCWDCGERGYGGLPPHRPRWQDRGGRRLLITHSMGPLLLPPSLLAEAEAVVLLAGFSRFVPPGPAGRRLNLALERMQQRLRPAAPGEAEALAAARAGEQLREFLVQAAAPAPTSALPAGPEQTPLDPLGRARLLQDLQRLQQCRDLPSGFPEQGPVLCVQAGEDRILLPEARELLRQRLPRAEQLLLPGAGHALLQTGVIAAVLEWSQAVLHA
ncbi:MAG: alpha/beta hydrolase [Synechococcaceae cyanobacterium]|nr:alpha/beta hydrolase [Synechococcaceae cyanobacterium]